MLRIAETVSRIYWVERDGKPVQVHDFIKWARWYDRANRHVAWTALGMERTVHGEYVTKAEVSTVFLGIDHAFDGGPPLLYETLVFGGKLDGEMDRYHTRMAALTGHRCMVERVRRSQAWIVRRWLLALVGWFIKRGRGA